MNSKWQVPAVLLLVAAVALLTYPVHGAYAGSFPPGLPRSTMEQAGQVNGLGPLLPHSAPLAGFGMADARNSEISTPKRYYQRRYDDAYREADLAERQHIVERVGNQGRARFAAERGWEMLLGSQGRGISQGVDSVYWDGHNGRLVVLEAKGGGSQIKSPYGGFPQNTNGYSIRAAERTLKSGNATPLEKLGAARVIKAGQSNWLGTAAVRTQHVDGLPRDPIQIDSLDSRSVARKAVVIERRVTSQYPELARVFRQAGTANRFAMLEYQLARGLPVFRIAGVGLGLAGAGLLSWEAYRQSQLAWELLNDSALRKTALPYFQAGIAAGRWGQATSLGLASVAALPWLQATRFAAIGGAAGMWFLPITVGVEALSASIAYHEYCCGHISRLEFLHRCTGPAIFVVCTIAGAAIGGTLAAIGTWGVGTPAGILIGANIGALIAIPLQFIADWAWDRYFKHLEDRQLEAADRAMERHYGLST